jgi:hypothetical protein
MKVISIIQPWATLIALGEKKFETRSWATKYRGELGIHASKKVDKDICLNEPFKSVLAKHGYTTDNLPTGAIIAISTLSDCLEVTAEDYKRAELANCKHVVTGKEYEFGLYEEGRYAWELTDVKRIEPIPAKGQLRMWEHPVL